MNDHTNVSLVYDGQVSFETCKAGASCPPMENSKMLIPIFISICAIFPFGLVGNGEVIWLLSFHIQKSQFTAYVQNLAVADFGVLVFLMLRAILLSASVLRGPSSLLAVLSWIAEEHFLFMYGVSQLFRISVICAMFFLNSRQPPQVSCLSLLIRIVIWVFSFFFCEIGIFLRYTNTSWNYYPWPHLILNVFISTKLMTVSILTFFMKVCSASTQRQPRHLTAILFALLFSMIFSLPMNVFYFTSFHGEDSISASVCFISASLNSSINPVIYFWVGKQKGSHSKGSIRGPFQRAFREEEEDGGEEGEPTYYNVM